MSETEICDICKDPPHRPGQCKRCGCGESEVIYPRDYVFEDEFQDFDTES